MGIFRALRITAIGVFFSGVLQVIQACSLKQEGAIIVFLLFFLNFCSGPVSDAPTTPPPIAIDTFTDVQSSGPKACGTGFSQNSASITQGVFHDRLIRTGGIGPNTTQHTITAGSGALLFDLSGACTTAGLVLFDGTSDPFNASAYSKIVFPITATTGVTLSCDISVFNDGVNIISLSNVAFSSSITLDISNKQRNKIDEISFKQCDSLAAGSFTLGPLEFR
jgi:hypothetical protein